MTKHHAISNHHADSYETSVNHYTVSVLKQTVVKGERLFWTPVVPLTLTGSCDHNRKAQWPRNWSLKPPLRTMPFENCGISRWTRTPPFLLLSEAVARATFWKVYRVDKSLATATCHCSSTVPKSMVVFLIWLTKTASDWPSAVVLFRTNREAPCRWSW